MTGKVGIFFSDRLLEYNLGSSHPLRPVRLKLTVELLKDTGILDSSNVRLIDPQPSSEDEIQLFHEPDYVNLVRKMSKSGSGLLDLGDTPAFKGCFEATSLVVGASLRAADAIMSGEVVHATNIAGGLHHAHPGQASGFCIFNDPAVTIVYLKKHGLRRILYLDIDAHHGDGVMYGFYSDPSVLDIDFHEDGRYLFPGTGFTYETGEDEGRGLKVNVPLPPLTTDAIYLEAFNELVPSLVRKYKPEFILVQCGADSHANDLLAHLQLTTRMYREVLSTMHSLAHEICDGRLLAFGGGGYNLANVPRAWGTVASVLAETDLPERPPISWRRLFEELAGEPAPELMDSSLEARVEPGKRASEQVRMIVNELKRSIAV